MVALLYNPFQGLAAAVAPGLGVAKTFGVLGGSTVTNTGSSVVTGDLGLSPGTSVTGFPPGAVTGFMHVTDAVALQAQSDSLIAFNALGGQSCDIDMSGQDLGGLTLTPGVYCFSSSAQLTGTLTLNAQGNTNAVFVFIMGSTLTTASNSSVQIINGNPICIAANVFWKVGSSATLGTGTQFIGNIIALTSITLVTDATMSGSALALTGAVTLDTNDVTVRRFDIPACNSGSGTGSGTGTGSGSGTGTGSGSGTGTGSGSGTGTGSGSGTGTGSGTGCETGGIDYTYSGPEIFFTESEVLKLSVIWEILNCYAWVHGRPVNQCENLEFYVASPTYIAGDVVFTSILEGTQCLDDNCTAKVRLPLTSALTPIEYSKYVMGLVVIKDVRLHLAFGGEEDQYGRIVGRKLAKAFYDLKFILNGTGFGSVAIIRIEREGPSLLQ